MRKGYEGKVKAEGKNPVMAVAVWYDGPPMGWHHKRHGPVARTMLETTLTSQNHPDLYHLCDSEVLLASSQQLFSGWLSGVALMACNG